MKTSANRVITKNLLKWYTKNKKSYPWRSRKTSPYQILVTEILLRKTTRSQVKGIFPIFFKKFPSIRKLSYARTSEIEKVITPLGMEKVRSKLLKKISKIIIKEHSGRIPLKKDELCLLPGVGRYITNAVLLLAKKERVPLVDVNAKRIVERIFEGESNNMERITKHTYDLVESLLPKKKFVEFNLTLLDFATAVCLPRNPKCSECPVKKSCMYYRNKIT